MSVKVKTLVGGGQVFFCPGCQSTHSINSNPNGPRWTHNNDPAFPTFVPSILVNTKWSENDPTEKDEICHSFVTVGVIEFLVDSTHGLSGKTVGIPYWPYAPGTYGGVVDD